MQVLVIAYIYTIKIFMHIDIYVYLYIYTCAYCSVGSIIACICIILSLPYLYVYNYIYMCIRMVHGFIGSCYCKRSIEMSEGLRQKLLGKAWQIFEVLQSARWAR